MIGWTPERRLENHPYDCGFKVSLYGAQDSVDPWDPLTYSIVVPPTHGTITSLDAQTGDFTYRADSAYSGADWFSFQASDTQTSSDSAVIDITISAAPSEIHGAKWHDLDADGEWDGDEPGLAGWKQQVEGFLSATGGGDVPPPFFSWPALENLVSQVKSEVSRLWLSVAGSGVGAGRFL